MQTVTKKLNPDKHFRCKTESALEDIDFLCREYHKTEAHIINEALRFGLPLLKEHLSTEGGLKPTNDIKFQEIIDILSKVLRRLKTNNETDQQNNEILLLIQAQNEIILRMISSVYQRQKTAWSYEDGYPELSEAEEYKMDFNLPQHYKKKLDDYTRSLMAANSEEGDE